MPRVAGSDAFQNAKEMSPDGKARLQRFAHEKLQVAKEALREFVEGFSEGKLEELQRQQQGEASNAVSAPPFHAAAGDVRSSQSTETKASENKT